MDPSKLETFQKSELGKHPRDELPSSEVIPSKIRDIIKETPVQSETASSSQRSNEGGIHNIIDIETFYRELQELEVIGPSDVGYNDCSSTQDKLTYLLRKVSQCINSNSDANKKTLIKTALCKATGSIDFLTAAQKISEFNKTRVIQNRPAEPSQKSELGKHPREGLASSEGIPSKTRDIFERTWDRSETGSLSQKSSQSFIIKTLGELSLVAGLVSQDMTTQVEVEGRELSIVDVVSEVYANMQIVDPSNAQGHVRKICKEATSYIKDDTTLQERISILKKCHQENLVEIVENLTPKNAQKVCEKIGKYGIQDEESRFKIAKIVAAKDEPAVSRYIQDFNIQDEDKLFEIAKIEAKQDPMAISYFIAHYSFKDEDKLFEIAKIAATTNGGMVSCYIDRYGFKDEDKLFEIAKIAATTNGRMVSYYIGEYGIKDEDKLFEIAKIAAAEDEYGEDVISGLIQNYGIKNEDKLFEIAKIAARHNESTVSYYVGEYGIKDENKLFDIAKIAAAHNGLKVSENIHKYGIKDEDRLFEIAKIAAAEAGVWISDHIENYGIKDEDKLFEIVKTIATENGWEVFKYIKKRGIKDVAELLQIAEMSAKNTCNYYIDLESFPFDTLTEQQRDRFNLILISCIAFRSFNIQTGFDVKRYLSLSAKELYKSIGFDVESYVTLEDVKQVFLKYINGKTTSFDLLKMTNVIDKILAYRRKDIAGFLLGSLILHSTSSLYAAVYKTLVTETFLTPRLLPSIIIAAWTDNQSDPNILHLQEFFKRFRDVFKDRDKPLIQTFLLAAMELERSGNVPENRKLELMAKACDFTKLETAIKNLKLLQYFCALKSWEMLNTLPTENFSDELEKAFESRLFEDFGLDDKESIDKYLETFGPMRIPFGFEIYKTIQNEASIIETIQRFMKSVLSNTFVRERMRVDNNPHLEYLQRHAPDVLSKWADLEVKVEVDQKAEPEKRINFQHFFSDKLQHRHFNEKQFPGLCQYLIGGSSAASSYSSEVDQLCVELILQKNLNKEGIEQKLEAILLAWTDTSFASEFRNDIKSLLQTLTSSGAKGKETAILTRDWQDLFLSGSEVPGSCQRIDGSASLNKCLMAYCLDGKNQMIAVKDPSGKILARAMLRLLWNENDNKPVLFLEELYPSLSSKEEAILSAAKQCAKELGCELLCNWEKLPTNTEKKAKCFGSSCPYEYVDAEHLGVVSGGDFEIKGKVVDCSTV